MKRVGYIVFRYLTNADFFNIYKPGGTEKKGGGQSYIDFGIGSIKPNNWEGFFTGIPSITRTQGPSWKFVINSIGLNSPQSIIIYQRRPQSFVIASQRITSSRSNRVKAWLPQYGFPAPQDPTNRTSCPDKLAIYIVRTEGGEFWAGWFQNSYPCRDQVAVNLLNSMLPDTPPEGHAGFLSFSSGQLLLDETDIEKPFIGAISKKKKAKKKKVQIKRRIRSEEEITENLFEEDAHYDLDFEVKKKEYIRKIISRNNKAVRDLKGLYQSKCQITGDKFSFKKRDGSLYCEAHHCIPLGEEGADSPYNIIIVNPLIHRMLHYAKVSEIDLSRISKNNTLDIVINGENYSIKWHQDHAKIVKKKLSEK
jgi:5-methylcytosine-specific restriction protein A